MNERIGVVSQLFGVASGSAAGTPPDEPLSGVARRTLAAALREHPIPRALGNLRTNLNKVSERIGFGDRVYRMVKDLPQVHNGGDELNLAYLCKLAGVDPVSLGVVVRTVPPRTTPPAPTPAPAPMSDPVATEVVAQPVPAPVLEPPAPKPPRSQPMAEDGRSVIVTNEPRASAWRSLRVMHRILVEEFNWPKDEGIPTWGCRAIVTWQWRFHSPSQIMTLMQKAGLVKCDTYFPFSQGVYLWMPLNVCVATRSGKDLPDMPEEAMRAELRYSLYHRRHSVLSRFRHVKIPESPR